METEVLQLRTRHPFIIARGGQSDYRTVWVRLRDSDGHEGWGETATDIPPLVGKVDGINIKLAKCGSLREAIRMVAVARAHGLTVMVGCMIESSIGITAAAHFTPLVDIVDLDGAALLESDPFVGAGIDGGQVSLPAAPGLGLRRR